MCAPLVMEQVARSLSRRSFLASGLAALAGAALAQAQVPGKAFGRAVDLTHELTPEIPLFPGAEPMRITTLVTVRQNGYYGNRLDLWEHSGTHMDAPAHFVEGAPTAEKLPVGVLIAPLAVIHIHEKAAKDPDAQVTPDDLLAYERRYGRLPKGAFVAMHSGWEARWKDPKAFLNQDASGTLHFPGFSPEAAEFLVREREIVGIGVDTLSLDFGPSKGLQDPRHRPRGGEVRPGEPGQPGPGAPLRGPDLRGRAQAPEGLRRPGAGGGRMVISWLRVPEEGELSEGPLLPEVLAANPRRAERPPRMRALVEFALKVTHRHHEMTEEDLKPLREAGLSDEAILEAAEVAARFNFTNRLLNSLGFKPNPEYYG